MSAVGHTPVPFVPGLIVEIIEPGIRPWRAEVVSVKFSPFSGWWVEARVLGSHGCWILKAADVRVVDEVPAR